MNRGNNNAEIRRLNVSENVNPLKEALTIEKLRTFADFENTPDELALEIIYTIDSLCRIVQEYLMNQNNSENNNQLNLAA